MKRVMALTAIVSVLALFVLTSQASAQDGPLLTADPPAVEGPGTYTFTLTGSGWSASPIFIVPCTVPGEQLTTASSTDAIVAALEGMGQADCILAPLGAAIPVGGDGTFTVEITHDVPANFAFGAGDVGGTEDSAAPVLFIADMGDDMAADGGMGAGFGGMAGSDGNSVAVPLAATLAAVVLLGGAALATRRHA